MASATEEVVVEYKECRLRKKKREWWTDKIKEAIAALRERQQKKKRYKLICKGRRDRKECTLTVRHLIHTPPPHYLQPHKLSSSSHYLFTLHTCLLTCAGSVCHEQTLFRKKTSTRQYPFSFTLLRFSHSYSQPLPQSSYLQLSHSYLKI